MTRRIRARAAFPAEVHVERFAPPPRSKVLQFMLDAGLDPGNYGCTQHLEPLARSLESPTGRLPSPPPIMRPPLRGPRPDLVIIDDLKRLGDFETRTTVEDLRPRLLPHQRAILDEAIKWWESVKAGRK